MGSSLLLLCFSHAKIVNVGLPRTGTTWFHAAMKEAGLRSLHCNEPDGCEGVDKRQLNEAMDTKDTAYLRRVVRGFDAFADLPWYNHLPMVKDLMPENTVYVATVRPVHEWSRSVAFLLPHLQRTCATLGVPCDKDHVAHIFYKHMAMVVSELPSVTVLDLSDVPGCARALRRLVGFEFNVSRLSQHINAKRSSHPHTHTFHRR